MNKSSCILERENTHIVIYKRILYIISAQFLKIFFKTLDQFRESLKYSLIYYGDI